MGSEKRYENKIKNYLKEKGCYFFKYWGGGKFTKAGIPDIICCCNGHFIGIEVKASTGRPSELQIYNLRQVDRALGFGLLLYPEDFDEFKTLIDGLTRCREDVASVAYNNLKKRWSYYDI